MKEKKEKEGRRGSIAGGKVQGRSAREERYRRKGRRKERYRKKVQEERYKEGALEMKATRNKNQGSKIQRRKT